MPKPALKLIVCGSRVAEVSYLKRHQRADDVPAAPPVTTSWAEFDELMGGDGRYVPDNVSQLRSTRRDILETYKEDVRHGTHCRVLTP